MPATNTNSHFPISYDDWFRAMSSALGVLPAHSYVEVGAEEVRVRMGWAFASRFPRSAVVSVSELGKEPASRGVHGFAGKWLVNGSASGVVGIELDPRQRGYVIGFPVRMKLLMVSVADPKALASALGMSLGTR